MTKKENILNSLNELADDDTVKVAKGMTEKEAEIFAKRIEKDISTQKGPTPVTTISKLRRYNDGLTYHLRFAVELWSSINLK